MGLFGLGRAGMVAAAVAVLAVGPVRAATICTVVADAASGRILLAEGDCDRRVTPASTFKVALAVMGFDAGELADEHTPVLPFREGYPDWGGDAWKRPVDPAAWMKHSVVWYSQQTARALGVERLRDYAVRFGYGNADFSGDPGKDNALDRAWISSSLAISPIEQAAFVTRLVRRDLPVAARAMDKAVAIVESVEVADGWTIRGKTGSAYPRRADGSFDRARGWGWYVGWVERAGRTLVFARLAQDESRHDRPAGLRTRDGLLGEFPGIVSSIDE